MRTIGSRPNVLFIIASAFGLLAALGRPWYAPSQVATAKEARIGDVQGPVESFFSRLAREFTSDGGTSGWNAFTTTDTILMALVSIAVISALLTLVPATEQPAREVVRLVTLAMLGVVVVKLVNTPDAAGLVERRQGAWIALGVTGIMASSAATLYAVPPARRKSGPSLYDTPVGPAPVRSHVFDSPETSPSAPPPADSYYVPPVP
jgi:hypothetical protein